MDSEYYDITSELDAREILRYLNDLGIHNISGEVLKYFITDLKKFIKYDLQKSYEEKTNVPHVEGLERLHSASTFCSRLGSRTSDGKKLECSRECHNYRPKVVGARQVHSAPTLGNKEVEDKTLKRSCSCVRVEKKTESTAAPSKSASSSNLIKVPRQPTKKKSDPVTLYHYYTSLWSKYKSNLPGENNWADLRWNMRQKMAGCVNENKVPEPQQKNKASKKLKADSKESTKK